MPAVAPSGIGTNEYYGSDEEYLQAVGDALKTEYQAIVEIAGFILQIDDPWLTEVHSQDPSMSLTERQKIAERTVEALNRALRGIPVEKIRFHTCYGINEGPRVNDASLKDIVDLILRSMPAPTRLKPRTRGMSMNTMFGKPLNCPRAR